MSGGRPAALTPESQSAFLTAIRAGGTIKDAAIYAGMGESTVLAYLAAARTGEWRRKTPTMAQLREFADAYARARVAGRLELLTRIEEIGKGGQTVERTVYPDGRVIEKFARPDWRAPAWKLERMYPEEFALRQKIEVITTSAIDAEIERLTAELRAQAEAGDPLAAEALREL